MTLKEFDDSYRTDEIEFIAGLDEAGRGPICGPVVCACVVLDRNFDNSLINDSKKLTAKRRKELVPIIKQNAAAYSITPYLAANSKCLLVGYPLCFLNSYSGYILSSSHI